MCSSAKCRTPRYIGTNGYALTVSKRQGPPDCTIEAPMLLRLLMICGLDFASFGESLVHLQGQV